MKLKVYYCENDNYSTNYILAELSHQLLDIREEKKLEVTYTLNPQVFGHSKDNEIERRFNILFLDDDIELDEDDRKYFAKISWWDKMRVVWMYRNFWIQKVDNYSKLIIGAISFIFGFMVKWFIGC